MRIALWLCVLSASFVQGTTRPDLSGTWTYVADSSTVVQPMPNVSMRAPSFGTEFTAKQDAETLTIDRASGETRTATAYKFDGSETIRTQSGRAGQPDYKVVTTASWTGATLTIKSVSEPVLQGKPTKIETIRTIHLEKDGTMVIETETRTTPPPLVPKTSSVYRKK
jgi:hypothetical protein